MEEFIPVCIFFCVMVIVMVCAFFIYEWLNVAITDRYCERSKINPELNCLNSGIKQFNFLLKEMKEINSDLKNIFEKLNER
jgi:hypothetical protein